MNTLSRLITAPQDRLANLGMDTSAASALRRLTGAVPNAWDNRPSWDNWRKQK